MHPRLDLILAITFLMVSARLSALKAQTKRTPKPQYHITDSIVLMPGGGLLPEHIQVNGDQIITYDAWQNTFKMLDAEGNVVSQKPGIPAKELGCGAMEFVPIEGENAYFISIIGHYYELDDSFSVQRSSHFEFNTKENTYILGSEISHPHAVQSEDPSTLVRGMIVFPSTKELGKISYQQLLDTSIAALGIWEKDAKGKKYELKKQLGGELTNGLGPIPQNANVRFEIGKGPHNTFFSGYSLTPTICQYDFEGNLVRSFGDPGAKIVQENPEWNAKTFEEDAAFRFCYCLYTNYYGQIYYDEAENRLYRVYEIAEPGNYPNADCSQMATDQVVLRNAQKRRALQIYDMNGEPKLLADFPVKHGFNIVGKLNGKVAFTDGTNGRISSLYLGEF